MHETEAERKARELKEISAMLRGFFLEKEKLEAQMKTIDGLIAQYGRGYWSRLGYTVMPRIEKLKAAILGE